MIKGTTKSGFKFEISDENINDYELFEVMSEIDENPLLLPKLLKMLLGTEQKDALIEHLRGENGKVSMESIQAAITEIFAGTKPVKNS